MGAELKCPDTVDQQCLSCRTTTSRFVEGAELYDQFSLDRLTLSRRSIGQPIGCCRFFSGISYQVAAFSLRRRIVKITLGKEVSGCPSETPAADCGAFS